MNHDTTMVKNNKPKRGTFKENSFVMEDVCQKIMSPNNTPQTVFWTSQYSRLIFKYILKINIIYIFFC